MVAQQLHHRHPSLEQLSPQHRSFTAAALRRGTIKISEPYPVENSGPSPVWPPNSPEATAAGVAISPPSLLHSSTSEESVVELLESAQLVKLAENVRKLQEQSYNPNGNFQDQQVEEQLVAGGEEAGLGGEVKDKADADQGEMHMSEHEMFGSARAGESSSKQQRQRNTPPLRQHRSSLLIREADKDVFTPPDERVSSSGPRSSTNESREGMGGSAGSASGGGSAPKNKRRSGSIRTAIKRMFSRKDKQQEYESSLNRRHDYHKSESALNITRSGLSNVAEESLYQSRLEPEDDYLSRTPIDTPRLPFPMNINAPVPSPYKPIKPHSKGGASSDQDPSSSTPRRRNTLPSIVIGPAEAEALSKYWTKEQTQMATPERVPQPQSRTPSPLIGVAITSNSLKVSPGHKRRSRSADALHDLAYAQEESIPSKSKGKEAEIEYWRSAGHRITDSVEELPHDMVRKSQAGSIGIMGTSPRDIGDPFSTYGASNTGIVGSGTVYSKRYSGDIGQQPLLGGQRGSLGSRNSIERGSQTTPNIQTQEVAAINRVDQRLSQIEQNMAHLAQSMQALSDRDSAGSAGAIRPQSSSQQGASRFERLPIAREQENIRELSPNLALSSNPVHPVGVPGRSVSMKQSVESGQPRRLRNPPSLGDLPSRATFLGEEDTEEKESGVPAAVAVPHDGTSPLPLGASLSHQYHRPRQASQSNVRDTMASPTVHNFSTPFPPAAQSPPSTPPTHMATKGTAVTDSSHTTSTGASSLAAAPPPPPTYPPLPSLQQPLRSQHGRAHSSQSYLTSGILPSQQRHQSSFKQQQQTLPGLKVPQHVSATVSSDSSPTRLIDHLAPLYAALRHERAVRKGLEREVLQLRRDMYELSAVVLAMRRETTLRSAGGRELEEDEEDEEMEEQFQHEEDPDPDEEFWRAQAAAAAAAGYFNLAGRLGHRRGGSKGSGNAFAQAQEMAAAAEAQAKAQQSTQSRSRRTEAEHQESLMNQYALAMQQQEQQWERTQQGSGHMHQPHTSGSQTQDVRSRSRHRQQQQELEEQQQRQRQQRRQQQQQQQQQHAQQSQQSLQSAQFRPPIPGRAASLGGQRRIRDEDRLHRRGHGPSRSAQVQDIPEYGLIPPAPDIEAEDEEEEDDEETQANLAMQPEAESLGYDVGLEYEEEEDDGLYERSGGWVAAARPAPTISAGPGPATSASRTARRVAEAEKSKTKKKKKIKDASGGQDGDSGDEMF